MATHELEKELDLRVRSIGFGLEEDRTRTVGGSRIRKKRGWHEGRLVASVGKGPDQMLDSALCFIAKDHFEMMKGFLLLVSLCRRLVLGQIHLEDTVHVHVNTSPIDHTVIGLR